MVYRVKIYGAGSIGNHLAHASRMLGWAVDMCDIDLNALNRTKNEIYPSRYQLWDNSINLYEVGSEPIGGYDLIFIGTPPDSHVKLALAALEEDPKGILIEKPLCTPELSNANKLYDLAKEKSVHIFTGYDHVVGLASREINKILTSEVLGQTVTIDVDFREYWGGIFAAHPWLKGPEDTYLGYSERGGGALGEHSHGINFFQYLCSIAGAGRISDVQAMIDSIDDNKVNYDRISVLNVKTEYGMVGRIVQDVVTSPSRKMAKIQCVNGVVEWWCGYSKNTDAVICIDKDGEVTKKLFEKNRPDDFILELKHIESVLNGRLNNDLISIKNGLDTALVIAAAFKSSKNKRNVSIDYLKGYTLDAIN